MWRMLLIISVLFTSNQLLAEVLPTVAVKFDLIKDEDVDDDDPRIKSIAYSAARACQSNIIINYTNPNAQDLAVKLAQILSRHGLLVIKPQQTKQTIVNDNKYVQVTINYQE